MHSERSAVGVLEECWSSWVLLQRWMGQGASKNVKSKCSISLPKTYVILACTIQEKSISRFGRYTNSQSARKARKAA